MAPISNFMAPFWKPIAATWDHSTSGEKGEAAGRLGEHRASIGSPLDSVPAGRTHAVVAFSLAGLAATLATPAMSQGTDQTVFYSANGLTLRWHLQAGAYAGAEQDLFWNLGSLSAPGFDASTEWMEFYIKPGISFEYDLDSATTLYGRLSAVASYTHGTDAFDRGDNGATTLEEAYLGLRGTAAGGLSYDISLGARELRLGTGMLIANGATSGFERGALKFGPRRAWEMSAIAELSWDGFTGTAFYLDPNELPSNDGENELAGLDFRYDDPRGGYIGATFVNVLNSNSPYVQARPGLPPLILNGARDGTNTVNIYGRTNPFDGALDNWTFTGDFAYQWNDRIDLESWAGRVQAIYAMPDITWSPTITYSFQTFSGDDPNTTTLERYDPLYYEGSPSAWATGSKSASTFINSNVSAHSLALRVQPTERDTVTFRYAHIRANELNSPIQFGQATRIDLSGNVVTGVTDAHLADDMFLEWNRALNRNTFLSAGIAVSFPGAGIDGAYGGSAPVWTGGYVNLVVNF